MTTCVRLGDLIEDARPGFASGDRDASGVLQLRMGAATSTGTVNWTKAVRVPAPPDVSRYWLGHGDVVFNNTNSQELVGRASLVGEAPEPATFSNHITRLRCGDRLDPGFLVFWLNSRWITGFFFAFAHRWVGQSAIQVARLLDLEIPLPPLNEQRRIAARLHDQLATTDAVRLGVESRLETLARVREEVLASTFARIEAPIIALGAAVSAPGAIADGPFGSHLKTEHYTPSGVRVIRLQNIGSGAFLDHDRAFVTAEHADSLTRHSARQGDVVVAALGDGARPAGRACRVPDIGPALVKADCFRVRTDDSSVDPEFLVWFLNSPRAQATIADQMRGATRPRVTLAMLRNMTIPLPPIAEQRRIAARLNEQLAETDRAKAALEAQRTAIHALPAALLREVFGSSHPVVEVA